MFTGAGGGIGSEVARGMAKAGAHVACVINIDKLSIQKDIESEGGSLKLFLDVTDLDNIKKCVDE